MKIWEDMSSQQVPPLGDQVDCSIYLPNEWNIPQISLSGYLTARYRACDLDKLQE